MSGDGSGDRIFEFASPFLGAVSLIARQNSIQRAEVVRGGVAGVLCDQKPHIGFEAILWYTATIP